MQIDSVDSVTNYKEVRLTGVAYGEDSYTGGDLPPPHCEPVIQASMKDGT